MATPNPNITTFSRVQQRYSTGFSMWMFSEPTTRTSIDAATLQTPYLEFASDSMFATASYLTAGYDAPLDQDHSTVPNVIMPLNQQNVFKAGANDYLLPSSIIPDTLSILVFPVKAVPLNLNIAFDNEDENEIETASSRCGALASGLKCKTPSLHYLLAVTTIVAATTNPPPAATKRFACNHPGCGRSFDRRFNLHTHEKTHKPEQARPFVCSKAQCGKAFTRKHYLQRHKASVHKGERKFACSKCLKSFSRQDGLSRHLTNGLVRNRIS
ncbi:hypothetical protein BGX23_000448 [Mortierella sp. AD031]|nr:hypothetical protein BGX23_000448 [Mortierella sp. AD031]